MQDQTWGAMALTFTSSTEKIELYMFNCCSEETPHVRNKPHEN